MDPRHPSLHFKKLHTNLYSVRVGNNYRALGILYENDLIVWIWIGSHADYDKLMK
jgi:plasmid maintenance system killer protein